MGRGLVARALILCGVALSLALPAGAAAPGSDERPPPVATTFQYPLRDGDPAPDFATYGVANSGLAHRSTCYGGEGHYFDQLSHAGEDWFRSPGTAVYPVAAGRVSYVDPNWDYGAVIVEHRLPQIQAWGTDRVYSAYLHVRTDSTITVGKDVGLDTKLGEVQEYFIGNLANHHLHWEMRRYASMVDSNFPKPCQSVVGPSYTDTGTNPDEFGYLNPSKWVEEHQGSGHGNAAFALCVPSTGLVTSIYTDTHKAIDVGAQKDDDPTIYAAADGRHQIALSLGQGYQEQGPLARTAHRTRGRLPHGVLAHGPPRRPEW